MPSSSCRYAPRVSQMKNLEKWREWSIEKWTEAERCDFPVPCDDEWPSPSRGPAPTPQTPPYPVRVPELSHRIPMVQFDTWKDDHRSRNSGSSAPTGRNVSPGRCWLPRGRSATRGWSRSWRRHRPVVWRCCPGRCADRTLSVRCHRICKINKQKKPMKITGKIILVNSNMKSVTVYISKWFINEKSVNQASLFWETTKYWKPSEWSNKSINQSTEPNQSINQSTEPNQSINQSTKPNQSINRTQSINQTKPNQSINQSMEAAGTSSVRPTKKYGIRWCIFLPD